MAQENSGPGFASHPGYTFDFAPTQQRLRVYCGDAIIADTTNPVVLTESSYGPVYYIPRADVRMDLLRRTDHTSYCPFKGDASYWTLTAEDAHPEGIAWSYDTPYDESLVIKDHLAFYADRVDEIVLED